MELQGGMGSNTLLAGDTRLVDHIVGEFKSQGIFDKFRKECIADVDTKPAYQNLRTRVEGSVNSFLNKQTWRTDLNKNQLRETLRKHIHEAPYLEVGVERIVDQVVNPKIYSVFMPQVEDVVYKFLGMERPRSQRNGACDLKDLLPKDLDPVSPESDRNSLKDASLESMDDVTSDAVNETMEQKPVTTTGMEEEKDQTLEAPVKVEEPLIKQEEPFIKEEKIEEKSPEDNPSQAEVGSPIKVVLNSSFKSDETNKTEEEEEDSPVFEPIDIMNNTNESNMSNDSHLSGISELTSHRSRSPDFMTEFSRDNFDCSNQDSQLSKVSSGSRLSIVTDFGSSNHASNPVPDSKEANKDKFNFDAIKSDKDKENSKTSCSSKESSRDASDYKESKGKDESKSKGRHDSKSNNSSNRDKDRDSRRRHSGKSDSKYSHGSKSRDKNESQESQLDSSKSRDQGKSKTVERKEDALSEAKDLKDLYKEKIRELREKKELTEKEKLVKDSGGSSSQGSSKDPAKSSSKDRDSRDRKESSSREKDSDSRRGHKSSSSSSRSSSYHKSKDSRYRSGSSSSSKRHSNVSSSSGSRSASKRDSKSDGHNRDRDGKRRRDDSKKPASKSSVDDHSSLRKGINERRSSDRDGSNGSSSKYSQKTSRLGTSSSSYAALDGGKESSSGETSDNAIHDAAQHQQQQQHYQRRYDGQQQPRRVDPGSAEICLPLKKRPLQSDESSSGESPDKKPKLVEPKRSPRKPRKIVIDAFKGDGDVTGVPDEERVQIIEITEEDYEQPYSDKENEQQPILSLEDTKNIIFNAEPTFVEPAANPPVEAVQSKLSEMEQSIRDSLTEMMSDTGLAESDNVLAVANKLLPVIDSTTSLIETLTDESLESSLMESSSMIKSAKEREATSLGISGQDDNEESGVSELEQMNAYLRSSMDGTEEADARSQPEEALGGVEADAGKAEANVDANAEFKDVEGVEGDFEMLDTIASARDGVFEDSAEMEVEKEEADISTLVDETSTAVSSVAVEKPTDVVDKKDVGEVVSVVKSQQEVLENVPESLEKMKECVKDDASEAEASPKPSKDSEIYQDEESVDSNLVIDEEFDENDKTRIDLNRGNADDSCEGSDGNEREKPESVKKSFECISKAKKDESSLDEEIKEKLERESQEEESNELLDESKQRRSSESDRDDEKTMASSDKISKIEFDNDASDDKTTVKLSSAVKLEINKVESADEKSVDLEKIKSDVDYVESIKDEDTKAEVREESKSTAIIDDVKEKVKSESALKTDDSNDSKDFALKSEDPSTLEQDVSRTETPKSKETSPVDELESERVESVVTPTEEDEEEEDCRYFENDNHDKYLQFKQFLDKLEASPTSSRAGVANKTEVTSTPAPSVVASKTSVKRRHTPSPHPSVCDSVFYDGNVDCADTDVMDVKESSKSSAAAVVAAATATATATVKKRKVGRAKKVSNSAKKIATPSPPPQPPLRAPTPAQQQQQVEATTEPQTQEQQPVVQQQQQVPATIVNGENIIFPLNVDNEVEKKDDKGRNRSKQRYSSDDLYKPRPLFPSSSRRNRRFNNQA